jgi:hypothetical protein
MSDVETHVAVSVDIVVDSDPIEGSVAVGDDAPREFCTWLELISVLDEARAPNEGDRR